MMTLGTVVPVVGGPAGKVELSFLVMDLCVAMRDALSTSSWSPSMGPILLSPNVISAFEFVAPPCEFYCIWFELYEGDV